MNSSGFGVAVYAVCNAPFGSEVQIDAITLTVYYNNAGPSNYLKSVGYAFAVPAGATVQGVVVEAEAKTDALTTPATLYGKLVGGGAVQTTARSIAVPTAEGYVALGSPTDLWGTTLTAAQLNAADFGVVLYVDGTEGQTVSVDHIRITVYYDNPTPTPTPTITPTATPSGVMVRSAWTADDTGETKSTFNPGETVRYYGELYNGTGITQTVSNQWQAWGACGWILNQATNESVRPTTNQWYIAAPLPTGNCGGVYTYTLGVTYNSITSTQLVTFSVTGPTPTPPPTGVEQVAIDYSYDPLYRLTRATYSGSLAASYAYRYDAVGNRLTQDANGTRTTYSYDNANRLTSVNGQAYTWDNNGNLTSDGLLTYSYDQANRLKQVTQGANTYTFAYNGVGDRLSQTVGITTTRYVLDPAAGLTQVLADGTNTYLYGNGRLAQYQAEMQYFGADGLGSVRQLYDATGQVLANNRYDPYGNVMSQYGSATSVFGYTGEQWDAATGLEYLRARYYSSVQGRFTTRDSRIPDQFGPQSLNDYAYAYNNPVRFYDSDGHCGPYCYVFAALAYRYIPRENLSMGARCSHFCRIGTDLTGIPYRNLDLRRFPDAHEVRESRLVDAFGH